jgi:hypothetical protein
MNNREKHDDPRYWVTTHVGMPVGATRSSKRAGDNRVCYVYFYGIFHSLSGDVQEFNVYLILSNLLKYPSSKILYYGREFLI